MIKICESASHASQGVSYASRASHASHASHASRASHASHASHNINVKNFYLLYLHSRKNKNKSIGTRRITSQYLILTVGQRKPSYFSFLLIDTPGLIVSVIPIL